MSDPWFFGYGSLVNRATHAYGGGQPARLHGWRRAWRATDARAVAYLTIVPDAGAVIDGLMAPVPGGDWAALDRREAAYDRLDGQDVRHDAPARPGVSVYAIGAGRSRAASRGQPVLLSYLDVVVQGFLAEFGPAGVARFFASTDGWDTPILNDRAAPRYPRAQVLSAHDRRLVDDWLGTVGARMVNDG